MPFYYELDESTETGKRIADRLLLLRQRLANEDGRPNIPVRTVDETLLLATWNIRDFDSRKYGLRSDEAIFYIAEIISHFDLVAIQEVNADLSGLGRLMNVLGGWWKYVLTDVTAGAAGNRERAAFVYDSRKVRFGGLSGEIVIPPKRGAGRVVEPARQLARTPFICGFQAGWLKLMLCSVHIYYGKSVAVDPNRLEEIRVLSKFLIDRVKDKNAWAHNMALLGDFNIFSTNDPTHEAIERAGFFIPPQFRETPSNAARDKHFDQIAFVSKASDAKIVRDRLKGFRAGVFDFFKYVYRDDEQRMYIPEMGAAYERTSKGKRRDARAKRNYYRQWRTHQMSDHFPMWIELQVDFGKEYLQKIAAE